MTTADRRLSVALLATLFESVAEPRGNCVQQPKNPQPPPDESVERRRRRGDEPDPNGLALSGDTPVEMR
jgi:hypothetical protein